MSGEEANRQGSAAPAPAGGRQHVLVAENLAAMSISGEAVAGAAGQPSAAGTTSAVAVEKKRALLPAPVWAHSFDYLPYEHVRSARLVCKLFGKEVPRHVETLSIFKSAEMDVPTARGYPNVREIGVYCLLQRKLVRVASRPRPEDAMFFNVEAFEKVVSFLHAFTGLEKLFLGGLSILRSQGRLFVLRDRYLPNMGLLSVPRNHKDVVRQFLGSLCDTFQTRALSQDINLRFMSHNQDGHLCTEDEGQSWICKKIFESLPLDFCSDLACRCMSYKERLEIMAKRPAIKASLLSPEFLEGYLKKHRTVYGGKSIPTKDLEPIYNATGFVVPQGGQGGCLPYVYSAASLRRVRDIIALGNDARKVNMAEVFKTSYWKVFEVTPALGVVTFNIFTKLGFNISTDNILILDEEAFPHLNQYDMNIYLGEEREGLIDFWRELEC